MRETSIWRKSIPVIQPLRQMLIMLLLSVAALGVNAQNGGKRITIKCNNEALTSVLRQIEKKSGVKVLFTFEEVKPYKVTMSVTNATAQEATKKAIAGTPLALRVSGGNAKSIIVSKPSSANNDKDMLIEGYELASYRIFKIYLVNKI